jgi:hypothetical protein
VNEELSVAELQHLLAAAKKEIALLKKQIAVLKANPNAKLTDFEVEAVSVADMNSLIRTESAQSNNEESLSNFDLSDTFVNEPVVVSRINSPSESAFTEGDDMKPAISAAPSDSDKEKLVISWKICAFCHRLPPKRLF